MTGKCNILKPVDSLTGTFFMFSQYAEDLTKQYSAPDTYRCLPSKFIALNLDFSSISGSTTQETSTTLGNIFQNYFENACTFLRGIYASNSKDFAPEYTRTLLFQTLEKYNMLYEVKDVELDSGQKSDGTTSTSRGAISGISESIQYIGDINIYSNVDEVENGVGYNEIYCYIPNEAKCYDYRLVASDALETYAYKNTKICGYENESPYNGLTYSVDGYVDTFAGVKEYGIGSYSLAGEAHNALIPQCLEKNTDSDDKERADVDSYKINAIVVLYDIYRKDSNTEAYCLHSNIPMGIYFTGTLDENKEMTNSITKYITSETVYNQGTSYGLRVCTRFLAQPNSTVTVHSIDAQGSTNVSEMTPVLQKMAETLAGVEEILDDHSALQKLLNDHLANFKNNKVNVPYVRQLGTKKYWFVNGKNTGAIAQYEMSDPNDLILEAARKVLELVYSKTQINNMLSNYVKHAELNETLNGLITKDQLDSAINNLENKLLTYLQSE